MDKKVVLDILFSAIILTLFIGPRFNSWSYAKLNLFSGKPEDYIDKFRYYFYCSVYLLTFITLLATLYQFPEFLSIFPSNVHEPDWGNALVKVLGENSITVYSFMLITLLGNKKVAAVEDAWRERLHEWARIPKAVQEATRTITNRDNGFRPPKRYLERVAKELQLEAARNAKKELQSTFWMNILHHRQHSQIQGAITWRFIECFCLLMIVKDECPGYFHDDLAGKEARLHELSTIIPFLEPGETDAQHHKEELNRLSIYFIECLCKRLIKHYPSKQAQYNAFKNLGFNIGYRDSTDIKIAEAIALSLLGILVVSCISVLALQEVLGLLTWDRYLRWASGSFICFCFALFIAIFCERTMTKQAEPSLSLYVITILAATISAFLYFHIASDLNRNGAQYARGILALSFSVLSLCVILALNANNQHADDVKRSAWLHALGMGALLAPCQIAIYLAYTSGTPNSPLIDFQLSHAGINTLITDRDYLLAKLGLIGLFKGFFLGGIVSYAIQDTMRRQQVSAMRKNPRARFNQIISLKSGDNEILAGAENISKDGIMLKCGRRLDKNTRVEIATRFFGPVTGVVKWSRRKLWKKQLVGIEFIGERNELHAFLRGQFGLYYA
ncbi:hypothetical protein HCH_02550 [Hahella chejuensis KCTC 2396]|uniref:PilZ domain-containing protein n=1 Tax=Hahella chejuensis (strain KCTC 2396) TaxID=349521 RepID=Q2SJ23_HAHCH|nr:PilZ domain-containing protein [Hahella chejuensis]ABC29351.1 hypothetical protein HCH_02550 [Hahella chejuensis KCTC 2396]